MRAKRTCSIEDCEGVHDARGWCTSHYRRWLRHGDPFAGYARKGEVVVGLNQRFWAKVEKNGPVSIHRPDLGPCWQWTSHLDMGGYGRFWRNGGVWVAHILSYTELVGPIPDGLVIDHLCRNRACVNPAHLEPVTDAENILRGEGPSARNARKTHCPQGHPYDEENTYHYRGYRKCRACSLPTGERVSHAE